jgi:hypothetical protein
MTLLRKPPLLLTRPRMLEPPLPPVSPEVVEKWRALAEQSRAHFLKQYMTGRRRLYYEEHDFMVRMREASRLAEMWNHLAAQEPDETVGSA